jgi:glycosyltransferase involved in cell wall biosynthesis
MRSKKKLKVLMVIPAYNEESNILNTCDSIKKYNSSLDIIVINDGSKDKTEMILSDNKINHVTLVSNLGIGSAVQTGYKYAYEHDYDIPIQFDGDGQHDAKYIEKIIDPIDSGQADFVIGSRFIGNISEFKSTQARRAGIRVISFRIKRLTGRRVTDPTSGFRAANRQIIKMFAYDYPTEYPEPESIVTLIRKNYRIVDVPVKMNERIGGVSSIRAWKTIYYMINVCLSIIINSLKR